MFKNWHGNFLQKEDCYLGYRYDNRAGMLSGTTPFRLFGFWLFHIYHMVEFTKEPRGSLYEALWLLFHGRIYFAWQRPSQWKAYYVWYDGPHYAISLGLFLVELA